MFRFQIGKAGHATIVAIPCLRMTPVGAPAVKMISVVSAHPTADDVMGPHAAVVWKNAPLAAIWFAHRAKLHVQIVTERSARTALKRVSVLAPKIKMRKMHRIQSPINQ